MGDKQTEEVKKFSEKKKKTSSRRRSKKETGKQAKPEDKSTNTSAPAFGKSRSKCQTKGHFSSVCYSSKKVHEVEDIEVSSSDKRCLRTETISLVDTKARQWFAEIEIFKSAQENFTTTVACQLDTGATCNVISLDDDLSAITQIGDPPMRESFAKLKLFGSSAMKPKGECDLQIKHNGTRQILKFQVAKDKCRPLLSAETCEKLQLIKLSTSGTDCVHQVNDRTPQECLSK